MSTFSLQKWHYVFVYVLLFILKQIWIYRKYKNSTKSSYTPLFEDPNQILPVVPIMFFIAKAPLQDLVPVPIQDSQHLLTAVSF